MVKGAHEMGAAPEFREEVEAWVARLLGPEWEVVLGADDTLADRAAVSVCVRNREATIMVCPTRDVRRNSTACHEVVHILLRRMHDVAWRIIDQLPEPLRQFARDTWVDAHEEVTEDVARAFMRAYAAQAETQKGDTV
jgi:hypothetical protein